MPNTTPAFSAPSRADFFCVLSEEAPDFIRAPLEKRFPVILLPPEDALPAPLRCHPDMVFSVVGDRLILSRTYYAQHRELLEGIASLGGFRLILSDVLRGDSYPRDVAFNTAVGKDGIVCHPAHTAPEILDAAAAEGLTIHTVRQGYASCSTLFAGRRVLTSDPGIAKILGSAVYEVFFADNTGILLPGYDMGFLGGCGGICGDTLYFTGNTDRLSSASVIRHFADTAGLTLHFLCADIPLDIGGIRFFMVRPHVAP